MKRLFSFILGIALVFGVGFLVIFNGQVEAAKPTSDGCKTIQSGELIDSMGSPITLGYDKWGYNYEAHMFNGWYDNASRTENVATSGDRLMMKWNDAWLSNKSCDDDYILDRHLGYPSYIDSGAWLTNHASGTYESLTQYTSDITGTYEFNILYTGNSYNYDVELVQSGDLVTGTLTDTYLPALYPDKDLPVTGSVIGNDIVLEVVYPGPSWGTRTYEGVVDKFGAIIGSWSDDGTDGANGTWSTVGATVDYKTCEWTDFVKIVAVPSSADPIDETWFDENGIEIGPVIWGQFAIIQEVSSDPCDEALDLMNYKSELRSGLGNW